MEKTAMIFAAGLGTRLRPLTDDRPKALVDVAGKPLLWHALWKLQDAGYRHIVVNTHHFADKIEEYLEGNPFPKLGIEISREDSLLDTGGGVLNAERYLSGCGKFLIYNVDILSDAKLQELEEASKDNLATLLVSERKTSRYLLFDGEMRLTGWTNVTTGEVRSPYDIAKATGCTRLAFSGIHIVSDKIFDAFRKEGLGGKFPIMDFYIGCCDKYKLAGKNDGRLRLLDVGKMEALASAPDFLKSIS